MKKTSIYISTLLSPLLCTATDLTSQENCSLQANPLTTQEVIIVDKAQEGNKKYTAALTTWNVDTTKALQLLREAEALGDSEAHKKLDEIRKSLGFKEPKRAKSTDAGVLLRIMEPTPADLFALGRKNSTHDVDDALRYFYKAAANNYKPAHKELSNIRKSRAYKNTGKDLTSLKKKNDEDKIHPPVGKDIGSTLRLWDEYKIVPPEPKSPTVKVAEQSISLAEEAANQFAVGIKDYKREKYSSARKTFKALLDLKEASPMHRASAKFYLAKMNAFGHGLSEPDYQAARQGFQETIDNEAASDKHKAKAQFLLAEMNAFGHGLSEPDYPAAKRGFRLALDSNHVSNEHKTYAQFNLAEMAYFGHGLDKPDYKEARDGFLAIYNNDDALEWHQAEAEYYLAVMDYLGHGLAKPDYEEAYQAFYATCENEDALPEHQACAYFFLTEMEYLGCGDLFEPNYQTLRDDFKTMYESEELPTELKNKIPSYLAEIDRLQAKRGKSSITLERKSLENVSGDPQQLTVKGKVIAAQAEVKGRTQLYSAEMDPLQAKKDNTSIERSSDEPKQLPVKGEVIGSQEENKSDILSVKETKSAVKVNKTLERRHSSNVLAGNKSAAAKREFLKRTPSVQTFERTTPQPINNTSAATDDKEVKRNDKKKESFKRLPAKNIRQRLKSGHKKEKQEKLIDAVSHPPFLKSEDEDAAAILGSEPPHRSSINHEGSQEATPFKRLSRRLSQRDLIRKSDVSLSYEIIKGTLDELKRRNIIDGKWDQHTGIISATKNDNQHVRLTIHKHDSPDTLWWKKPENVVDFLDFVSKCDPELAEQMAEIGKKK